MIRPEWPAPANVRALVTTRDFGDVANPEIRAKLRALLPAEPFWLRQVHGTAVAEIDSEPPAEADAAISRKPESVCAVFIADCMPVLYSDEAGSVVGIAHAGWRGLSAPELCDLLRDTTSAFLAYVEQLPEDTGDARSSFALFRDMSPHDWLFAVAVHSGMHLVQVREMKARLDFPKQ